MQRLWPFAAILYSYLLKLLSAQQQLYFPNINLQYNIQKKIPSNFTDIFRYEVIGTDAFEFYSDGRLVHLDLGNSRRKQVEYFNPMDNQSAYYDEVLVDFGFQTIFYNDLHFLLDTGIIVTYDGFRSREKDIMQLTEFQIYNNSLLEVTNESFYVINPKNGNESATIFRVFRKNNIDPGKLLLNAQQLGLNISLINQTQNEQDAPFFNSTDSNISDSNTSDLNASGFSTSDFNFTNSTSPPITFNFTTMRITSNLTGLLHAKVCKQYWDIFEYLAVWNQFSEMQIFKCTYFQCLLQWSTSNEMFNLTKVDVEWGNGCMKMYVTAQNYPQAVIYWANSGSVSRNYTIEGDFASFMPSGWGCKQSTVLFLNGSFNYIASSSNYFFLYEYREFANVTAYSRYIWNLYNRRLLINSENYFQMWSFTCSPMMYYEFARGICLNCSQTCDGCGESTGFCTACIQGYRPNPNDRKSCRPLPPPSVPVAPLPNHTHQNFPSDFNHSNSNSSNSTNSTTSPSVIDNNTSNLNSTTTNTPLKYGALYVYEVIMAQTAIDGFGFIGQIIKFLFLILQMAPLAWLFLNFMNFWNICSFYLFLNADIPQYLRIILKLIYDKVNTSIFNIDVISEQIYHLEERLPELQKEYEITSSFLVMNLQSFIFLLSSTILTILLKAYLKSLRDENYLKKKLSPLINLKEIISNQFISMASNFMLPLSLIFQRLNFQNFDQVPNMILHMIFIGMSLGFPFMIVGRVIEGIKSLQQRKLEKRQKIKDIICEKKKKRRNNLKIIQWIFLSNCNTLVPFLCVFGIPEIYYVFGLGFFSGGIGVAWRSQSFRVNEIILSLYPMVFHVFFTIIAVFGSYSTQVKHHSSMVCTIVLFMGAIHEILWLFIQVILFMVKEILKIFKRIRDQQNQNMQKEQKAEKIFQNIRNKKLKLNIRQTNFTEKQLVTKKIRLKRGKMNLGNQLKLTQAQNHELEKHLETSFYKGACKHIQANHNLPKPSIFKLYSKNQQEDKVLNKNTDSIFDCMKKPAIVATERRRIQLNKPKVIFKDFRKQQVLQNPKNLDQMMPLY